MPGGPHEGEAAEDSHHEEFKEQSLHEKDVGEGQILDPLKIHCQIQEDAARAKRVKN